MTLRPADVQDAAELIAGSKVMVCQLEVPQETSLEALRVAKQHSGGWSHPLVTIVTCTCVAGCSCDHLQHCSRDSCLRVLLPAHRHPHPQRD